MNLKDAIDVPLVKVVAAMNLLGFSTRWACCGFNYKDQNKYVIKSHVYGKCQIHFILNSSNIDLLCEILGEEINAAHRWHVSIVKMGMQGAMGYLQLMFPSNPASAGWDNPESPHYYEIPVNAIAYLEKRLLQFHDKMVDTVVVHDQNAYMKSVLPHWNVEPCEPWLVKKEDLIPKHQLFITPKLLTDGTARHETTPVGLTN